MDLFHGCACCSCAVAYDAELLFYHNSSTWILCCGLLCCADLQPVVTTTKQALATTTKEAITTKSALYDFCITHTDCGTAQFCGNKCWTGQCGPNANIGMGTAGQFCQPCGQCVQNSRSVTGSCDMCPGKVTTTTKSATTTKAALYGFCIGHSDCGSAQFCGNKCWTGQCGPVANINMGSAGQFCQPCGQCVENSRSVTGSCNMCPASGKER